MQTRHSQKTHEKRWGAVCPGGTQPADEVIARSGITFHLWRLYQHAWLGCLFFPLVVLVREPLATWHLVLGLVFLLVFAASYTWLMWPHPARRRTPARAGSWFSLLLFAVLSLLVLVFTLTYGLSFLWLFVGVSALAGVLLPMRSAFAAVMLFTLLPLILTVGMKGGIAGVDWWWLIALMLLVRGLGLDMIGAARMGNAIRELHAARRELARLAVIEERERLARDLHDLLGQTLSVITLKSELARGLVAEEPARCAQELAEIEQVSRKTLREVRKTVVGYRQPTLANELDGVRQLLEAAGIMYDIEQLTGELPPALDAALAWSVREGVTNVIRHSRARHCRLRLTQEQGWVSAEILNDREQAENSSEIHAGQGSGLLGLQERVNMLGGAMEAGLLTLSGKPYFRLCVELPTQHQVEAIAVQEE